VEKSNEKIIFKREEEEENKIEDEISIVNSLDEN
jgi:hypothetical protein